MGNRKIDEIINHYLKNEQPTRRSRMFGDIDLGKLKYMIFYTKDEFEQIEDRCEYELPFELYHVFNEGDFGKEVYIYHRIYE